MTSMSAVYVKICDMCGYENPETAESDICLGTLPDGSPCRRYLGSIEYTVKNTSEPRGSSFQPEEEVPPYQEGADFHGSFQDSRPTEEPGASNNKQGSSSQHREERSTDRCPLFCFMILLEGNRPFQIRPGSICGRTDPTIPNQVGLDGVANSNFIHRRHCQFTIQDGKWHVAALVNPSYTNPTHLNAHLIPPGESRQINNGDILTLSGTSFILQLG